MKVKSLLKDEIEVKIDQDTWEYTWWWSVVGPGKFGIDDLVSTKDYATKSSVKRAFKTFAKRNGWKNYKFV